MLNKLPMVIFLVAITLMLITLAVILLEKNDIGYTGHSDAQSSSQHNIRRNVSKNTTAFFHKNTAFTLKKGLQTIGGPGTSNRGSRGFSITYEEILELILLLAALYIILSRKYNAESGRWAMGTIGVIVSNYIIS